MKEITESNRMIAEFMGMRCTNHNNGYVFRNDSEDRLEVAPYTVFGKDLEFHTSWSWLMPVVGRIESEFKHDVRIYGHYNWKQPNRCSIVDWKDKEVSAFSSDSKIESVYQAVVQFIQWYNSNKK